ncbi:MAG: hypothetical protein Q7S66_02080 [bacterium]|nr:hypothetical protein [bacterium]
MLKMLEKIWEFIDILWSPFKAHIKKFGGLYIGTMIWAGIFNQLSHNHGALNIGGSTDYWGWLFWTYWAVGTGFMIGISKDKK